MKKYVGAFLLLIFFVAGCGNKNTEVADGLDLRQALQKGEGYSFCASVTADYGDRIYNFVMDCKALPTGNLEFTVTQPETINGVTGEVSREGGKLIFDEQVILFEPITQGQLTPVIGPWLLVKAVQGGYIRSVSENGTAKEVVIDDTYSNETFQVILTLQKDQNPAYCQIFWNNRRILSIEIENFKKL